jgi:nitric oxide reductase activation protein
MLERAMVRAPRPFDHQQAPAPARDSALLLLIDQSGSMGDNWDTGSLIAGALRATMLLARAAELADITCGICGFTDEPEPVVLQPLARGTPPSTYRRIAGMDGYGDGTWFSDVFHHAVQQLAQRSEPLKLLVIVHDGAIVPDDAQRVQADVATLPKRGIVLQPVLVGTDTQAIDANTHVFGHVLACPNVGELAQRLSAWLRAVVAV